MAALVPDSPLEQLSAAVNKTLIDTGRFFRTSASPKSRVQLKSNLPVSCESFQSALDRLSWQVALAKSLLEKDYDAVLQKKVTLAPPPPSQQSITENDGSGLSHPPTNLANSWTNPSEDGEMNVSAPQGQDDGAGSMHMEPATGLNSNTETNNGGNKEHGHNSENAIILDSMSDNGGNMTLNNGTGVDDLFFNPSKAHVEGIDTNQPGQGSTGDSAPTDGLQFLSGVESYASANDGLGMNLSEIGPRDGEGLDTMGQNSFEDTFFGLGFDGPNDSGSWDGLF